jgi:small subunit ribosomal protein S2
MTEAKTKKIFNIDVDEMSLAGLHFGHRTSKVNPKMKPYIFGVRNGIHIIDLEKTADKLREALEYMQKLIAENKTLLIVGTKVQVGDLTKEVAKECGLPYVTERWLGGTFTNFETISRRVNSFKELEAKRTSGEREKYTKKERAKIDKKLKDFEFKFGGIKNLDRIPDAIFVLDMKKDALAVKEAKTKGVKIIGIAHTNVDPALADYPIPANDDSVTAVKYILEKTKEVLLKVRSKQQGADNK